MWLLSYQSIEQLTHAGIKLDVDAEYTERFMEENKGCGEASVEAVGFLPKSLTSATCDNSLIPSSAMPYHSINENMLECWL
jgi:hypothetical protein